MFRADGAARQYARGECGSSSLRGRIPGAGCGQARAGSACSGAATSRTGSGRLTARQSPCSSRCAAESGSLRSQFVLPALHAVLRATNRRWRGDFRVVQFSAQSNHLHLLVEAGSRRVLLGALRGLSVRLARSLNRLLFRRGPLLADRWHGRALPSPRAVRQALIYVLGNARKHGERIQGPDPASSAPYFRHFVECPEHTPLELDSCLVPRSVRGTGPPVAPAATWLLTRGWLRHGPFSWDAAPQS